MDDVLEEREGLRVRLVVDDFPAEPYHDGRSPILQLHPVRAWGGWRADHIDSIGGYTPAAINNIVTAAAKWAGKPDLFGRYLRMFHGTVDIQWYDGRPEGGDYVYVTFDTLDWRAYHGIGDDQAGAVDMDDWRAYCEGDVYGHIIEQRAIWRRDDSAETRTSWEHVESCFGFYDRQYAEQAARQAFNDLISELAAA